MKTTKRGKLLMLACAALVAVLACLPAAALVPRTGCPYVRHRQSKLWPV